MSVHLALSITDCSPLYVCETVGAQPETPEICNIDISAIDNASDFWGGTTSLMINSFAQLKTSSEEMVKKTLILIPFPPPQLLP